MPANDFPHLEILAIERGEARLEGGGDTSEVVRENKANRRRHAYSLSGSLQRLTEFARQTQRYRADENLPEIREGVPFVLQVSESDEELLFFLSDKLGVEVVAEDEEGFILVASKDIEAKSFQQVVEEFVQKKRGGARAANILQVIPESDSEQRLKRILPENLREQWPFQDDQIYTLEVSIKSATAEKLPTLRRRRNNENSRKYNARAAEWRGRVEQLMAEVEDERIDRESVIEEFVAAYQGEFLTGFVDNDREHSQFAELSDSFSTRIRMSGRGFKDLILNFPYVFEATLPDEFEQPGLENGEPAAEGADLRPPAAEAPAVCIVDSGIQEGHIFLAAAIDSPQSRCFLPGVDPADVADYVANGGHGTRVAGVALYGDSNPLSGMDAPFWLQNARFLDDQGWIPIAVFPPLALREIVAHFRHGPRRTRIFNHSVAGTRACWRRRMSTWAAEIDRLSEAEDVLFIQAIGNVEANGFGGNNPTIADHLSAGRAYPDYLREPSAMLANPAQSLQAITVGSLALGQFANGDLSSLAQGLADPSGFSRTGLGL